MYVGLFEVFLFSPVSKILHLADSDRSSRYGMHPSYATEVDSDRLGRYSMHPSYATEVDSKVYELSLFLS